MGVERFNQETFGLDTAKLKILPPNDDLSLTSSEFDLVTQPWVQPTKNWI